MMTKFIFLDGIIYMTRKLWEKSKNNHLLLKAKQVYYVVSVVNINTSEQRMPEKKCNQKRHEVGKNWNLS